ncbi:MAG: 50S ribosomal protein L3 [Myxococcales bacterium]|nr:50S ribosomal protein L3 [Myxococcales bacterium]
MSLKMGLLGRKVGMTQVFWEDGTTLGCTVLELGPCLVTDVRNQDKHGYSAVQIGLGQKADRHLTRPDQGQLKAIAAKAGEGVEVEGLPKKLREVRLEATDAAKYSVGSVLGAKDVFKAGDVVDVTATSKGKGYQGVMKRHHMAGFRATHGTHEFFRHGGSIGCRLTPGRVHKGKRMSGRMGNEVCTTSNLVIVRVLEEQNVVIVKGSVPGPANGLVLVKGSAKNVKREAVKGPVKETESKNPMKASKKGAPAKKK